MNTKFISCIGFFLLFISTISAQNSIQGSFISGGISRNYEFYVPAIYNSNQAVPLVIGFHGLSSSGAQFAQYRDFRPIADTANFIFAYPDGSSMLGVKFWNYDNVLGSTVDDVTFIEALIDTIASHYQIDHNRIYLAGMSNGSFMAYKMACETNRFAAIGCVTGSMSPNMHNHCNPLKPTPVIHIHGTDDSTNPYNGTSSMVGIENLVEAWANLNACEMTPQTIVVPDINNSDQSHAIHYIYHNSTKPNAVEHFKIENGGHSWPGSPMPGSSETTCLDFDATLELWRFFNSHVRTFPISVDNIKELPTLKVWPNPATDIIQVRLENTPIKLIKIVDITGRTVLYTKNDYTQISISHLKPGVYYIQVRSDNYTFSQKFLKQ